MTLSTRNESYTQTVDKMYEQLFLSHYVDKSIGKKTTYIPVMWICE